MNMHTHGRDSDASVQADSIARYLLKPVNRAVGEFGLIADGDVIAVGVSGGKDSRTLLELLVRGVDIPGDYRVVAIHVDGTAAGLPDQRPVLEPWLETLGIPYHFVPLEPQAGEALPMTCFRCARNRRRALFLAADRLGCATVALGHHADDAVVTTLMSLLHKGRLETMEPSLSFFGGRLRLIRPMIHVPSVAIARYARARQWAFPPELECSLSSTGRRARIEQFLATFTHRERKQIRANVLRLVQRQGCTGAEAEADYA